MYSNYMSYFTNEEISTPAVKEEKSDMNLGLDMNFFTSGDAKKVNMETKNADSSSETKPKKTVTRKKKEDNVVGSAMVADGDLPMIASNQSYLTTYNEQNNMLRGAIAQTDVYTAQIQADLDSLRSSKSIRSKYTYIANLTGSATSLITAKIQAIREMDGNITNAHNLDLKRAKDLKAANDDKNDDQKLMQMYDAFVNIPIGTYSPQAGSTSMQALTTAIPNADPALARVNMNEASVAADYNSYISNLSPAANRARMEGNPNIKTVVMYDPNNGNRYFDVIDTTTNQSVPNIERPGEFLLKDTDIDIHNGIATNRNINTSWPLIIVGGVAVTEY